MMNAQEVVQKARSLLGCRFRPQGRDPALGLDCVGLAMQVFAIPPEMTRRNYRLRGPHGRELEAELARFLTPVANARAGDALLCKVGINQMHLAIHCGSSVVHADAHLRRVVEVPGEPIWPVIATFRHRDLIKE